MATSHKPSRFNLKTLDYYKFRKLVIDGNRDDFNQCSEEIQKLCNDVQMLSSRNIHFDEKEDKERLQYVYNTYKEMLTAKRLDPMDVKLKSGWWGEQKGMSVGRAKMANLRSRIVDKVSKTTNADNLDVPGIFVIKHKTKACWQLVEVAPSSVLSQCSSRIKTAFEGSSEDHLSTLIAISTCTDWTIKVRTAIPGDPLSLLSIIQNDCILQEDSLWPNGLNTRLTIQSELELKEFRKSAQRYNWPSKKDVGPLDIQELRRSLLVITSDPDENERPITPPTEPANSDDSGGTFVISSSKSDSSTKTYVVKSQQKSDKADSKKRASPRPKKF
ncbi:unnamed protein product [Dimorphilus gyrociliatus]|uniref:Uncharacterized protein n=1 Tax=Dimorphilus gyrociliatus TaxID=2664684 RepID=A0A7I8VM40_9ANNE|nr:unnamed protein product [Dimorphilus gyrociliatus]